MRCIVSSKSFWLLMEKEKGFHNEDGFYELVVDGNKLHFNSVSEIDVESKEGFRIELSKKQFKRLRKVVRALEKQPIVLYKDNSFLYIQSICF